VSSEESGYFSSSLAVPECPSRQSYLITLRRRSGNQCEDVRPQEQWRCEPGPKTMERDDVEQLSLLSHSAVPCLYRCSLKCKLKALDLTAANKLSLAEIVARCNYLSSSFPAARPTTCHDKFQRPRLHQQRTCSASHHKLRQASRL
jgi:hypothetical protein